MGEQKIGKKPQLSSFSYATFKYALFSVWVHFCANQTNITYSETVFCKSAALDSVHFEVPLY